MAHGPSLVFRSARPPSNSKFSRPSLRPVCTSSRGGVYYSNESTTWVQYGLYTTELYESLGLAVNADYGSEVVALGSNNSGLPFENDALIGRIADPAFWLGLFGISPQASNFSDGNSHPSFFTQLRNGSWIGSRTWAYTAGSYNRKWSVYRSPIESDTDDMYKASHPQA